MTRRYWSVFIFSIILMSCGGKIKEEDLESDVRNQSAIEKNIGGTDCTHSLEGFRSFIGLKYGTNERELIPLLGKFSNGNFSEDSTSFIYYYNHAERVPISIWVDAKTGDVETIFIEVLSFEKTFKQDVLAAQKRYTFSDCDMAWFGLTAEEIEAKLGKPTATSINKENATSISYDSETLSHSINFKIYPSQGNVSSALTINWFYK